MAGLEADTSSYPRQQAPANPLDIAGKLGQLQNQAQQFQQGQINIDQSKLKLYNDHFQILNNELSNLANDPNVTKEKVLGRLTSMADMLNMPPQVRQKMVAEFEPLKTQEELKKHLDYTILRGQDTNSKINSLYGQPGSVDDGQNITPSRQLLRGGPVPSGAPISKQLPASTGVIGPNNEPTLLGPQLPRLPIGAQAVPGGFPGQYSNRLGMSPQQPSIASPLPTGAMDPNMVPKGALKPGETVTGAQVEQPTFNNRFDAAFPNRPTGPTTGTPPDYEPGLKQFAADQDLATAKLTAIKPALQALPLAKELTTGIGTDTYNKILAAAHNLGLLPEGMSNKVAVYQELSKKLAQYVSSSPIGQRSDAAQTLAEASSPSPKTQISPALIKLTQDAIALDRVQAIRSMAFTDANGNPRRDYHNYGQHRGSFPAKIDERALSIDMMTPEKRNALLDEMEKKQNTFEGKKFKYTLELADKLGLFDMNR